MTPAAPPVARLQGVGLRYGQSVALTAIDLDLPGASMVGIIGPDGVGKSSLLALIAGARRLQSGSIEVLGGSMADSAHRRAVCPRIAYMPQGLGKNLYPTLTVGENLDFFARLFGHDRPERQRRSRELLRATGLEPFGARPAGQLSGGMQQKLALCCALIHDPDLLILDEPTTGVDPLARRQFWDLIARLRARQPGMSVLVATAYMEEAARFDSLVAMNAGRILATAPPAELLQQTGSATLEAAFIALLPPAQRAGYRPVTVPPRTTAGNGEAAIAAHGLTMRFGDFTAVDRVSFRIERGEIFGFLGSNGCGKTTTMKLLTGLLPASAGEAWLFGHPVDPHDLATRRRVGYMSQSFSLYSELTVQQNLELHARLFALPEAVIPQRVAEMAARFGLRDVMASLPNALPLGQRQRLSLAVAMIHGPELLILDEPTSGVDPVARDNFWQILIELARRDQVTIFISTHFLHEAERCDRVSLMHAGQVLASAAPATLMQQHGTATLEAAFIHLLEATSAVEAEPPAEEAPTAAPVPAAAPPPPAGRFRWRRLCSYLRRETLELGRDPIRLTLATLGSALLLVVMGYGITLDVEDLTFAALDRDQTALSRDYLLTLSGSRYFVEHPPLASYAELDRRMRSGELSLAIEIPPGFARDLQRGAPVAIGAWIDGAMPSRGETVQGYVQGMHSHWLASRAELAPGATAATPPARVETRFRYNPEVKSLPAMVPAVIPLLLLMIPAILSALAVVREKELGSIVNLYVTPVTRLEFLLGKQIPYVVLAFGNFLLLTALAVWVFGVPFTGSFAALAMAAGLYVVCATALGLVISAFMRTQIAALFATAVLTVLPAVEFSGMIDPVSSLAGFGAWFGRIYPTTHFLTICRGTFSKGLGCGDLSAAFLPLLLAIPVLIGLGVLLLRKQER